MLLSSHTGRRSAAVKLLSIIMVHHFDGQLCLFVLLTVVRCQIVSQKLYWQGRPLLYERHMPAATVRFPGHPQTECCTVDLRTVKFGKRFVDDIKPAAGEGSSTGRGLEGAQGWELYLHGSVYNRALLALINTLPALRGIQACQ